MITIDEEEAVAARAAAKVLVRTYNTVNRVMMYVAK